MKQNKWYIAFDLGAESGRCLGGTLINNRLVITEIHRFPNRMQKVGDHLYWDILYLYNQIIKGLNIIQNDTGKTITSIGVDTWGVDFGMLDGGGNLLGMPHAYRDKRTDGIMELFFQRMDRREIYDRTGIQFLPFNTLFQLFSMQYHDDPLLSAVSDVLFIPDIFAYLLTGKKISEFTFATTSQLYNPVQKSWDEKIFENLKISSGIMQNIIMPGTVVGSVCDPRLRKTRAYDTPLIAVASHDTGSAIAAVPSTNDFCVYISCGTWSLMGFETAGPMINDQTYQYGFTNEGGMNGTFRILKNIMGLWLLQECRRAWPRDKAGSYDDIMNRAHHAKPFQMIIDPDDPRFLHPANMLDEITAFARESGQKQPRTVAQITRSILEGLALCYRSTFDQIRAIESRSVTVIHLIGGGSKNTLLCQMTANATGVPVIAGPAEATGIGNILVQAIAAKQIASLADLRDVVRRSCVTKTFEPKNTHMWEEYYQRFKTFRNELRDNKEQKHEQ